MRDITYEETLQIVSKINRTLESKGFNAKNVGEFWDKLIKNIPRIKKAGIDNIEVCKNCGHLNIEDLKIGLTKCCPNSYYIKINKP